jgi:GT2 family glycosyltransferase
LIRHLKADPSIGLIGPSTNAIGNEAIVEVSYREIGDMPRFAEDFMRANDRKMFDIAMLAMFCVAMRRDVLDKVGLLDENFGIGMYEDDDYAHRIRLEGFRVVCTRDSFVHHWMKAAFGKIPTDEYKKLFEKNRAYYEKKWSIKWQPHKRA